MELPWVEISILASFSGVDPTYVELPGQAPSLGLLGLELVLSA
jgi:hypothetical protein